MPELWEIKSEQREWGKKVVKRDLHIDMHSSRKKERRWRRKKGHRDVNIKNIFFIIKCDHRKSLDLSLNAERKLGVCNELNCHSRTWINHSTMRSTRLWFLHFLAFLLFVIELCDRLSTFYFNLILHGWKKNLNIYLNEWLTCEERMITSAYVIIHPPGEHDVKSDWINNLSSSLLLCVWQNSITRRGAN